MKKKYALIGTGWRATMFLEALGGDFKDAGTLVALCDTNHTRMKYWNDFLQKTYNYPALPCFDASNFDQMLLETKPDCLIITTIDRTHHTYICRALEAGCEVISEKPMTVDAEKCQEIVDTVKKTNGKVTVTFNYRYAPRNTKIKEILKSGMVGEITSVHFEWLLDTGHGADYFRRWHRNKNNSGGLLVHKATHHFDLMNWWLDSRPELVFALGALKFYGRENAEKRNVQNRSFRGRFAPESATDPFAFEIKPEQERLYKIYYEAEKEDGYIRDLNVFGDGISIEDNMGVIVHYKNKTIMTYSLNAHSPWEGYRVCFNGTRGRLEFNVVEKAFLDIGEPEDLSAPGMRELNQDKSTMIPEIIFQAHWGKPQRIDYDDTDLSGHGGGDNRLLNHVLRGVKDDPLGHAAGFLDGAYSILTGIAANQSIKTGQPVLVDQLVKF